MVGRAIVGSHVIMARRVVTKRKRSSAGGGRKRKSRVGRHRRVRHAIAKRHYRRRGHRSKKSDDGNGQTYTVDIHVNGEPGPAGPFLKKNRMAGYLSGKTRMNGDGTRTETATFKTLKQAKHYEKARKKYLHKRGASCDTSVY